MDPEIAELFEVNDNNGDVPDFTELFEEEKSTADTFSDEAQGFTRPAKFEEAPKPHFRNKNYYKEALTGEGEISKKVHSYLGSFLNAKDNQDRSMYRSRLIPAYWDLLRSIAGNVRSLTDPKRLVLRFGILLPTLLGKEQITTFSKIIYKNNTGEPIHYVDEWLEHIAYGKVSVSATDETKISKKNEGQRLNTMVEKTQGRFDAQATLIRNKVLDMQNEEQNLRDQVDILMEHDERDDLEGMKMPYNDAQRNSFSEINIIVRKLGTMNRELSRYYNELDTIIEQLEKLKERESYTETDNVVDNKAVVEEMNTVRQMAKLCVGRQGNHFPILTKQYFRGTLADIATRENIINILADIEYLDPGIFIRSFKQQTNRIVPNIVLIPCYGDQGICWEPFERFNRATGKGRLAIPLYPKDLRTAVASALADLRWQVAKEKAQHYWMEEGLTGWYYQWFTDRKLKGDVRESFIQDYILWITKESEGTQKLDREIRGIFWRYLPFPQDVRDKLKNRGFVYNELYKKDINRSMSDGY